MRTLWLKKKEDLRIRAGHLWVFSNEVDTERSDLKDFTPGEEVTVCNAQGHALGSALINPKALICARLYSRKSEQAFDSAFLQKRFEKALLAREQLFSSPWYRLVHGEGDFLPGLVIDRFNEHVTIEITTIGMEERKELIVEVVKEYVKPKSMLFMNAIPVRALEGLCQDNVCLGPVPSELLLPENGAHYHVPLLHGQKTGWFFDQRENRRMAARFAKGCDVLDAFCYLGGFGVLCAREGAKSVTFMDASKQALAFALRNAKENADQTSYDAHCGDILQLLPALKKEGRRFDLISIDPPAFIKRRKASQEGIRAYRRLNAEAIALLKPGGILVSSSCSFHLKAETLLDAITKAAAKEGLACQLLYQGRQGPDHPELIGMPETSYLKCFIVRMQRNS
ncbi:MAG: class I SAM-dependent rRNA methyltransferase [Desulfovibrio sp.]|nr:class I SAM-dependent rRNA methyltransferase [Desulfovibrio sp.]